MDIQQLQQKYKKWNKCFVIGIILVFVSYIIAAVQQDSSILAIIFGVICFISIIFTILATIKISDYKTKLKKKGALKKNNNAMNLDVQQLQQKYEKWSVRSVMAFFVSIVIILFAAEVQEDMSFGAVMLIIWLMSIVMIVVSLVKSSIYKSELKRKGVLKNTEKLRIEKAKTTVKIECPYCHSTATRKISSISKAGSAAMWGIFSQKVHKQWHCYNCNSDF
jgi:hypothetical protein